MGKYFTTAEMCVSGSHPELVEVPKAGSYIFTNLQNLINKLLDPIREKLGKPITVSSGYRPPKLNTAVKGAANSNHLYGNAADVHTGNNGTDNVQIVKTLLSLGIDYDECIAECAKFDKQGNLISCDWVHLAYRSGNNRKKLIWTADFKTYHLLKSDKEIKVMKG